MTNRIVCPKCSRASYTTAPEVFGPCPYCGFVFNWRSPDRRLFERTKKAASLTLEMGGKMCTAEIIDISKRGAGVVIHNPPFVKEGDLIRCTFKSTTEEARNTKVVWSKESDDSQKVGLLFL